MEQTDEPTPEHWRCVSDAINLLETMQVMGLIEDADGLLKDAVFAMGEAGARYEGESAQVVWCGYPSMQGSFRRLRRRDEGSARAHHDSSLHEDGKAHQRHRFRQIQIPRRTGNFNMTEHQIALVTLLKQLPIRGARVETILRETGMTRQELAAAGDGLKGVVTKEKTTDWNFAYRMTPIKQDMAGVAASREAVPMHALAVYIGEKSTHRVSL